jgi:hypothetical protein
VAYVEQDEGGRERNRQKQTIRLNPLSNDNIDAFLPALMFLFIFSLLLLFYRLPHYFPRALFQFVA